MGVLYSRIERDMACPKEVVIWNYWDREHLTGTHYRHYKNVKIIAEQDNWCLAEFTVKLPLIPLYVVTRNFGYMPESNHMSTVHFGKVTQLQQDFYFKDNGPEACTVTLENRMSIPLPKFVVNWLQPVWQRYSTKWFIATWEEDLPMRLRRWKVLKLGFRDFAGIDYINQKKQKPDGRGNATPLYSVELPVKKSTPILESGWPRLFSKSVEVGYGKVTDTTS